MGVFLLLSPPVHCGQLLKEAVADESKLGELIKPYFQKEMAGRPHAAQRPQPPGLWGSDGSVGARRALGGLGLGTVAGKWTLGFPVCRGSAFVPWQGPLASGPAPSQGQVDMLCYP